MNVSVFGLGYVGSVSAASFAADGHTVVGVDVNPDKVASLNEGRSPIVEKGLDELIRDNAANGRLRATTSTAEAVRDTEISLICVGTPSRKNGSLDLTYLERVAEQIGEALKDKESYHVVVVRSTVLPGTTHEVVIPALERTSGKKYGTGFGVTVNPEFLREGTAIHDFRHPPLTLVGHNYQSDAEPTKALYGKVEAPIETTTIRTAEMMKYASNTWHALKVTFANEIGNVCKRVGIDSHEVMNIFCKDEKLNLSSYYMKPGFAFGGSCLPKDVRALQYRAKEVDLDMPVIQAILGSNQLQIQHAIDEIVDTGKKRVGLLGFSFKAGTDDLRESPIVILAEALLGKGFQLCIYDKNVSLARLVGANKDYINKQIPHLSSLLSESIDEVLDKSDVIVVGNGAPEFGDALTRTREDHIILDLVRVKTERSQIPGDYRGICW
jgi:GDP-mannose 6-dehydrogenase